MLPSEMRRFSTMSLIELRDELRSSNTSAVGLPGHLLNQSRLHL